MFVGRELELKEMNRLYESNTFQMFVLYGRRRVGKTTLLKQFCKNKPSVFFSAENSNEKMNLLKFSELILDYFGETMLEPFQSWEKALLYIDSKSRQKSLVVILDEFPYLAEINPGLLSILQHMIDHRFKEGKLFLVLCGSYMGFMEREVLGSKSPIFGRRTAQLHLKAFDYYSSMSFMNEKDISDKLLYYGIFGGTPLYLNQIAEKMTLEENLKYNFFTPTGYLYEEPQLLLQQELREPGVYHAIIEAIANGAVRLNEIHQKTGEDRAKCSKYISVLMDLGILYRELPMGEKENSRKGVYQIEDNMFRFWNRFVSPNKTLIETDAGDIVIEKRVLPYLSHYMGNRFEEICKQFLLRKNRQGELPFLFTEIGRWWGTDNKKKQEVEIDIIAHDGTQYLFGECKWRNEQMDYSVLEKLIDKSNNFNCENKYFALFSKSGFSNDLILKTKQRSDVLLYTLEDFIA